MTTLEIWDSADAYKFPNIDEDIQGLKFAGSMYGGFLTCSFDVYRKPWKFYPEFQLSNIIKIRSRHQIVWQGRISGPGYQTSDYKVSVEADGPNERLKTRMSLVSLGAAAHGGAWINTNLIGDADLGYTAGSINATTDYAFPSGIDFSPDVYYLDAVESINKANGFRYGVFKPRLSNVLTAKAFDFTSMSTAPDYYLDMQDCDTKIQYVLEGIENRLRVSYSADGGTTYSYFWWPDSSGDLASKSLYGLRDGKLVVPGTATVGQAQQLAGIALARSKRLRPATEIVAYRITDITGAEVPLPEVQPGGILHIRGLNPGEFTLLTAQSVNELCTWPIVMASPDVDAERITLSPGGLPNTLNTLMSRMEMRKR
jgi:hypothetical protein